MQIQKHLYRIHERTMKNALAPLYWNIIYAFTIGLSILYLSIFVIGNLSVLPNNNLLSECVKSANFKFQNDTIHLVYEKQIGQKYVDKAERNNNLVNENDICFIIKDLNTSEISIKPLEFSYGQHLIFLDDKTRADLKFTNYTFIFKETPVLKYFIYGMSNLITNQLIYNQMPQFPQKVFIKSQTIIINGYTLKQISWIDKIWIIVKTILNYFVISIVTSLYIYGTIISAPAVIILFLRCTSFVRNGNFAEVYKIFPWIGIHSLIRQTSQNAQIKNSSGSICRAMIFYFFFLYFIYYALVIYISTNLFFKETQMGLQEVLFGYVALIQFCSIVFMRTRPFLRYFPATHSLLMLLFLLYGQFCQFGLKKNACLTVSALSATLFCLMILKLQIPSQTTWDRTKKYTPSVDRPRIGMFPLFNMSWINNLPQQWTLLIPLYGRQNFTQNQLSFVDRNFVLLDQVFHQNNIDPIVVNENNAIMEE